MPKARRFSAFSCANTAKNGKNHNNRRVWPCLLPLPPDAHRRDDLRLSLENILLFSLPLMATQVLEVLFNLSDVAIAGKYAYNTYIALGSVGSTTTLVSCSPACSSAWAAASTCRGPWLGMGSDEDVEHTNHSSLLICLSAGILTCLVCVFFAEPMLRLLNTKEEFLPARCYT